MKKTQIKEKATLALIVIVIIGIVVLSSSKIKKTEDTSVWRSPDSAVTQETLTESNSKEFKHPDYRFSFRYPNEFTAETFTESDTGSASEVILVQNANEGKGFQIMVSPFDEGEIQLTEERIKADVPDLEIRDAQPLLIGETGQGLAFKSDNEQFAGKSREVWFVFNGNLYQISTYEHLDPVLQAVFATWKFE